MVTRYVHGITSDEELQPSINPPVSSQQPAVQPIQTSVARYQHTTAGAPGTSVAGTLNSTFGKPSVELVPGQPSSRTSVETAEREGLIRRDGDRWIDLVAADGKPAAFQEAQEPQQAEQEDLGAAIFDKEVDTLFNESIADMDQNVFDTSVASVLGVVALGNGSLEDSAKSLAMRANMEPERAQLMVDNAVFVYQTAADTAMSKLGIEGDQLEQMYVAFRAQPRQLMPAIQRLALARDPSALVDMAKAWKLSNP